MSGLAGCYGVLLIVVVGAAVVVVGTVDVVAG